MLADRPSLNTKSTKNTKHTKGAQSAPATLDRPLSVGMGAKRPFASFVTLVSFAT
jgi:hypothetical protein